MYTALHVIATVLSVPVWVVGILIIIGCFADEATIQKIAEKNKTTDGHVRLIGLILGPMLLVIAWFMVTL